MVKRSVSFIISSQSCNGQLLTAVHKITWRSGKTALAVLLISISMVPFSQFLSYFPKGTEISKLDLHMEEQQLA